MATTLRALVTTEEDASSASYGGALRAMGELCVLWGSSASYGGALRAMGGAPNLLRCIVYIYMRMRNTLLNEKPPI